MDRAQRASELQIFGPALQAIDVTLDSHARSINPIGYLAGEAGYHR